MLLHLPAHMYRLLMHKEQVRPQELLLLPSISPTFYKGNSLHNKR